MGRCTPQLPGDRGNTCPALLGTSSSRHPFVSVCRELNVEPPKTVKAALLWSFVGRTQKLGEGRDGFPLPPTPAPSLISHPGWRDMHWMDRTQLPWSCTDHYKLTAFKQRAGTQGSTDMQSPNLHFIRQCLCYQNEYSFTIAVEENDSGSTLRKSTVVIITSESSAPARGESLCFSCCRQSISARGKHSTPLLLSAEEL